MNTKVVDTDQPKALAETEGLVSISQAAQILDVSIDTVRRWDKNGTLKSTRPDGKNRYFSVEDLQKLKFSQPLSISEASEQLNVSASTLRRLEAKGLIKPLRGENGDRVYDKKSLESFLQSEYFMRQKEVQDEVLEPFRQRDGSPASDGPDAKLITENTKPKHDPTTRIMLSEHHITLASLRKFRKYILISLAGVMGTFVATIIILTLLFFLFPESTAKNLGYIKRDPIGKKFIFQPADSLLARQLKPFSQTALRVVEAVNPELRQRIAPVAAIKDVNDIFQPDEDGNVKSIYTFTVPDTSYLKIPDQGLVQNLNSEFIQGRIPGCEKGNLAIVGVCAGVTSTLVSQGGGTGGGTTVVNASSNTLGGDVTSVDAGVGLFGGGADGAIKLRVELQSGSGMEATTAGLSLARSCANNQLLKWNGFGWACASDDGGTPPDMFSTVNASVGTSPIADNPNDQLSLLGSGGLSVSGEAINDTITFGLDITVSGVTTTTSSISGLETSTDGLRLIGGCSSNQILKWNGAVWVCSADTGGIDVKENNVMTLTAASATNYNGNDFTTTNAGGGQVDIAIDYPNSRITRANQNETITGAWTVQQTLTFNGAATDIDTAAGQGLTLQGRASSLFTTTAGDINLNPSGSASASVVIGGGASNNVDLLILDRKNDDTLDPVGTAGAMYYNLASQKFRCYQGVAWTDCVGAGGGGGGSSVWSDLTGPVAPLTIAHGEFPTTFNWSANNTLAGNLDAFTLTYTNDGNSDPNIQRLLVLKNQNNGIVDPGTIRTEALLRLEHNDDSILDKGIQIISSASGPINTGIDVSDGGIGTALSVGNNNITGTTPNITFDNLLFVGATGYLQLGSSGWVDGASVLKLTSGTSINLDATNNTVVFADNDVFNIGGTSSRAYNSISGSGAAGLATNDNDLYIEDILEVDGNTNLGGSLTVTNSYAVGGVATGLAYNAISNAGGSANGGDVTDDNDLFVQGALEIDGNFNIGGTTLSAVSLTTLDCSDCIDWDDIKDAMTQDAATTTTRTSTGNESSLVFNYINNGGTAGTDNFLSIVNAISSNSTGDLNTEALLLIDQADTTTTGNSTVDNGLLITNSGGSALTNGISIGSGSQAISTGINLASTGITTDLRLQNAETIDNDTDNQLRVAYGATGGTLFLQNGSNLTTDQTTFNLLNTTATTINLGGAATTALNIGSLTTGVNSFAADTDWVLAGSENLTVTNSSVSTDLVAITATGVTSFGVDGLQVTYGSTGGSSLNTASIHAILTSTGVSGTTRTSGLKVTGVAHSNASVQSLIYIESPGGNNFSGGRVEGLRIESLVGGTSIEEAISVGSGWDVDLLFDDITPVIKFDTPNRVDMTWVDSSNNNLLQAKELGLEFGMAVNAGAFIDRNSKFEEEFSKFVATTTAASGGQSTAAGTRGGFGDGGGWGVLSTVAGCSYSSTGLGYARIQIAANNADCLMLLDQSAAAAPAIPHTIVDVDNKPVILMKVRPSDITANHNLFAGVGDKLSNAVEGLPTNFLGFRNSTTTWQGVASEAGVSETITCTGQTISTSQFALLMVEITDDEDATFYVDNDVSNGINFVNCGTITSNTSVPNSSLAPEFVWESTALGQGLLDNLDIDFFRVWQDDPMPTDGEPIDTAAIAPENNSISFTLTPDRGFRLLGSNGQEIAGIDYLGNATFKGEVTAAGLNINGSDGEQVAGIDSTGTATLAAVDAKQIRSDQVIATEVGAQYYGSEPIEPGDVVALDPASVGRVKKSDTPYSRHLLGVAARNPSLLMDSEGEGTPVIVALAGRVTVNVSTENGAIEPGDSLTSSSTPGVAMKATKSGPVIGKAVFGYDSEGVGTIVVVVNGGFSAGDITSELMGLEERLTDLEGQVAGMTSASSVSTATGLVNGSGEAVEFSNLTVDQLTVNLDMVVNGPMQVNGPAEFTGTTLFDNLVTFGDSVLFNGSVTFGGDVAFNKNTAGFAEIRQGESGINVVFAKPFASPPVITISLGDGKFATYSYRNVTANGFEIILPAPATEKLKFSWVALSVNDVQTYVTAP